MKKLYLTLVAAMIAAVIPMQGFADNPKLSVGNGTSEIKVDITSDTVRTSLNDIFTDITTCTDEKTQELTFKADAAAEASIRLEVSEIPASGTNPLDNYKMTVTDDADKVVYNSADSEDSGSATYKDIKLGSIDAGATKKYTVKYELIDDGINMSMVSVQLAVKSNAPVATVAPTKKPAATSKPLATPFPLDSLNNGESTGFVIDFDNELPKDNTGTSSTDNKVKEVKKVCGKDIPAGRYSVSGHGTLKITSANGREKSVNAISETPVAGKSVKNAVVFVEDGDVLVITPLDGQEKARLEFNKVATAEAAGAVAPKATKAPVKTNPKTGDAGVGVIVGIASLAVLAFTALEVLKRRSNHNN